MNYVRFHNIELIIN